MEKLLISNIGNRNIHYKNKNIPSLIFREETEKLWKNINTEKEHISIQIIPNHIHPEIQRIILVSTWQDDTKYNYQDTFYEGLILKKLLEEQYQIAVDVEVFKGNPTDENHIFPFYSDLFKTIISEKEFPKIVFNDAGGTPQMKLVVKELLSYYLPAEDFSIVYSDQKDVKRDVERSYKNKYVLLQTARKFVDEFNYSAALRVLEEIHSNAEVTKELITLTEFAARRINFEIKNLESFLNNNESISKHDKNILKSLLPNQTNKSTVNIEVLNKHSRNQIFEIASICQLYFGTKNYTLGVSTYYRLMEEFFNRFVKNHSKIDLTKFDNREDFISRFFNTMQTTFNDFYPERELMKTYGLPLLSLYTYIHADEKTKNVVDLFMKTISLFRKNPYSGLDLLRNKCFLAHKNNAVNEEMINKTEPEFLNGILPAIFEALNMPGENIYYTMNRMIHREFLNN